jgi:hypothetical protein
MLIIGIETVAAVRVSILAIVINMVLRGAWNSCAVHALIFDWRHGIGTHSREEDDNLQFGAFACIEGQNPTLAIWKGVRPV